MRVRVRAAVTALLASQEACFVNDGCLPTRERARVLLVRHGESEWNAQNRFTGWADVRLTARGIDQMQRTAKRLAPEFGCEVAAVYTSHLKRAVQSAWVLSDAMDLHQVPLRQDWRISERAYGALTGMDKAEVREAAGDDEAFRKLWLRPPAAEPGSCYDSWQSPRLREIMREYPLKNAETFVDVAERCAGFWDDVVAEHLLRGDTVALVMSKNAMRGMLLELRYRTPKLRAQTLDGRNIDGESALDLPIDNGDVIVVTP